MERLKPSSILLKSPLYFTIYFLASLHSEYCSSLQFIFMLSCDSSNEVKVTRRSKFPNISMTNVMDAQISQIMKGLVKITSYLTVSRVHQILLINFPKNQAECLSWRSTIIFLRLKSFCNPKLIFLMWWARHTYYSDSCRHHDGEEQNWSMGMVYGRGIIPQICVIAIIITQAERGSHPSSRAVSLLIILYSGCQYRCHWITGGVTGDLPQRWHISANLMSLFCCEQFCGSDFSEFMLRDALKQIQ